MKTTKLSRIKSLTPNQIRTLSRYGIRTDLQLLSLCELSDCKIGIRVLLDMSNARLDKLLDSLRRIGQYNDAMLVPQPISAGMLGAAVDSSPAKAEAVTTLEAAIGMTTSSGGYPRKVSLADKMPAVRDQGGRGSCVAFGMIAGREFEAARQGRKTRLSEQHLYYLCKKNDGHSGGGTYPHVAMQQLNRVGVCTAKVWPYNPSHQPGNEGQGQPPPKAEESARSFRTLPGRAINCNSISAAKAVLSGQDGPQRPIPFAVPLYTSFGNAETRRSGDMVMPAPNERLIGGHMMAATGYEDDASVPGGGWIHFRNSWGASWAPDSKVASGYGRMPYAYWVKYARSTYVIEEAARKFIPIDTSRVRVAALVAALIWGLVGVLLIGHLETPERSVFSEESQDENATMVESVVPLLELYDEVP